jgi:DNA topoisomerase VI subunit B
MHRADPNAIAKFRATTASALPLSHVRKRCACNKVVTSIQLERYGMCATCYKAKRASQ